MEGDNKYIPMSSILPNFNPNKPNIKSLSLLRNESFIKTQIRQFTINNNNNNDNNNNNNNNNNLASDKQKRKKEKKDFELQQTEHQTEQQIEERESKGDFDRIYVVFLMYDSKASQSFRNRLASCYTNSDYIHCEIYFPNTNQACSIDTRNPVSFTTRNYTNRAWDWFSIKVNKIQYDTVYNFCVSKLGEKFDSFGLLLFPCPIGLCSNMDSTKWLCSRLCASALKSAQLINHEIDAYTIDPNSLRNELKNQSKNPIISDDAIIEVEYLGNLNKFKKKRNNNNDLDFDDILEMSI